MDLLPEYPKYCIVRKYSSTQFNSLIAAVRLDLIEIIKRFGYPVKGVACTLMSTANNSNLGIDKPLRGAIRDLAIRDNEASLS
ncbi:putative membrane protein insertion efficiency factor [Dirofilaria immitis]